jgi:hypothetical protein
MTQQTPRAFDVDVSGEVLDRLIGLHQFISPDLVRLAVHDTGRRNRSDCRLTHEVMLWVVLAMGILTDVPIRQVFKHARRLRKGEPTPPRNTLCKARRRLGVAPVRYLFDQLARPLATPETPGAFYQRLRLMGLDGTTYDLPDTPANVKAFGRPKGPRADAAFPQIRKLSLVELGTHAEVALVLKPSWRGETAMVAGLARQLREGMLLLWDRNFFSYDLWRSLTQKKVHLLARVKGNLILEPIEELADGSYLAKIYRNAYDRRKGRNGIVVRVIKYTLDDPARVGHGQEHTLLRGGKRSLPSTNKRPTRIRPGRGSPPTSGVRRRKGSSRRPMPCRWATT